MQKGGSIWFSHSRIRVHGSHFPNLPLDDIFLITSSIESLFSLQYSGIGLEVDNVTPCIVVLSLSNAGAEYRLEDTWCAGNQNALCKCSP